MERRPLKINPRTHEHRPQIIDCKVDDVNLHQVQYTEDLPEFVKRKKKKETPPSLTRFS